MSKILRKKKAPLKINSMKDLEIARERYRYEVRLQEQAMLTGLSTFRLNLSSSIRQSFHIAVENVLINTLVKLIRKF